MLYDITYTHRRKIVCLDNKLIKKLIKLFYSKNVIICITLCSTTLLCHLYMLLSSLLTLIIYYWYISLIVLLYALTQVNVIHIGWRCIRVIVIVVLVVVVYVEVWNIVLTFNGLILVTYYIYAAGAIVASFKWFSQLLHLRVTLHKQVSEKRTSADGLGDIRWVHRGYTFVDIVWVNDRVIAVFGKVWWF